MLSDHHSGDRALVNSGGWVGTDDEDLQLSLVVDLVLPHEAHRGFPSFMISVKSKRACHSVSRHCCMRDVVGSHIHDWPFFSLAIGP